MFPVRGRSSILSGIALTASSTPGWQDDREPQPMGLAHTGDWRAMQADDAVETSFAFMFATGSSFPEY